jgi:hypothetical protein
MEGLILLGKVEFLKRNLYQQDKRVDLIGIDFGLMRICAWKKQKNWL